MLLYNTQIFLVLLLIMGVFMQSVGYAWNAMGHQLVAQIAYDEMNDTAKRWYQNFYRSSPEQYFVKSSTWLDEKRKKHDPYYDSMHYIDIPFSTDGTTLPMVDENNAVSATLQAIATLQNSTETLASQREALKILIHVVGDLHQPLHAATRVSQEYPLGDKGGNQVHLSGTFANNLHAYWDSGGGFLNRAKYSRKKIKRLAKSLEIQYPCKKFTEKEPSVWANQSHALAVQVVYNFNSQIGLDQKYQKTAVMISKKHIAKAGCSLGQWINEIAKERTS